MPQVFNNLSHPVSFTRNHRAVSSTPTRPTNFYNNIGILLLDYVNLVPCSYSRVPTESGELSLSPFLARWKGILSSQSDPQR